MFRQKKCGVSSDSYIVGVMYLLFFASVGYIYFDNGLPEDGHLWMTNIWPGWYVIAGVMAAGIITVKDVFLSNQYVGAGLNMLLLFLLWPLSVVFVKPLWPHI